MFYNFAHPFFTGYILLFYVLLSYCDFLLLFFCSHFFYPFALLYSYSIDMLFFFILKFSVLSLHYLFFSCLLFFHSPFSSLLINTFTLLFIRPSFLPYFSISVYLLLLFCCSVLSFILHIFLYFLLLFFFIQLSIRSYITTFSDYFPSLVHIFFCAPPISFPSLSFIICFCWSTLLSFF